MVILEVLEKTAGQDHLDSLAKMVYLEIEEQMVLMARMVTLDHKDHRE